MIMTYSRLSTCAGHDGNGCGPVCGRLPNMGGLINVTFRKACASDVADIARLLADDDLGRGREDLGDLAEYRRAFALIDEDPRQLLVVAVRDATVVGTVQLSIIPSMTHRGAIRAQIEGVRVSSASRGSGIGRAMLQWTFEQARANHCAMVQLTTDKRRPDAKRFYESMGFTASHEGMKCTL
jgi:GNAT superfamily N-acetyltransferase